MADQDSVARLLNSYRDEIRAKSPKSLSVWQGNRTVMPAGVGSVFRLADPFPLVVKRAKGPGYGTQTITNTWTLCSASRS